MSKKILIVDIGNTSAKFAVFEGEKLQEFLGFFSIPDELESLKKALISYKNKGFRLDDGMIFSVVPSKNAQVQMLVQNVFAISTKVFDWQRYQLDKKNTQINESIGADLLADIKQARAENHCPCLIADFGTITKLIQLDENGSFEGLSMIPGLETTVSIFSSSTALLPKLKKSSLPKNRLGLNTAESMLHGAYYSTVYYVKDVLKSLNNDKIKLIITGGNLRYVKGEFPEAIIDSELTLKGMNTLYQEISKWVTEILY